MFCEECFAELQSELQSERQVIEEEKLGFVQVAIPAFVYRESVMKAIADTEERIEGKDTAYWKRGEETVAFVLGDGRTFIREDLVDRINL